jgi:hypothetical protein
MAITLFLLFLITAIMLRTQCISLDWSHTKPELRVHYLSFITYMNVSFG